MVVLGLTLTCALGAAAVVTGQKSCNSYMCVTGTHDSTTNTDTYTLSATSSMVSPSSFGWIAMGFGTSMIGSPMIIAWPNSDGSFTISQRQASQHAMPTVVSSPPRTATLQTTSSFSNSSGVGITFTLPGTSNTTNGTNLIWAYGSTNPESSSASATIQQHLASGNMQIALLAPMTNSTVSAGTSSSTTANSSRTVLIAHVVCGALATMCFLPVGILVPRIARGLTSRRWWFPIHSSGMGIFSFAFVIAAFAIARSNFPGGFDSNHRKLGLALFILMFFQVSLGIFVHWGRSRLSRYTALKATSGRGPTNYIHMAFGVIIVATGFATAWKGIDEEWGKWSGTGAPSVGWKVGWGLIVALTALAYISALIFLLPRQFRLEAAHREQQQAAMAMPSRPPIPHSNPMDMRYQNLYGRGDHTPPTPPERPTPAERPIL